MQWIDEAACACGSDWTGAEAITAYVAGVRFCRSLRHGDAATVSARIIHTGPRSVHTSFRVTAENDLVAFGVVVVVSPDAHDRARLVPEWEPASDEERRLDDLARRLDLMRAQCGRTGSYVFHPV